MSDLRVEPGTEVRMLLWQAREALRHTREYVGEETLPAVAGWSWYDATVAIDAALAAPEGQPVNARRFFLWKFVHNALIHPLLSLSWSPRWAERAHDWTAARCWGAG